MSKTYSKRPEFTLDLKKKYTAIFHTDKGDIKVKLFGCWDVTLLNDMYAFIFTGLLKSRMKKK